jgi:integrase/recombinase XerD
VLTDKELMRFYDTVWHASNRVHVVMIKVLLYTGIRNAELANITLKNVDLKGLTIRITQSKGKKDRYVPFPVFFRGELAQYIENQKAR